MLDHLHQTHQDCNYGPFTEQTVWRNHACLVGGFKNIEKYESQLG
jgi:hypothetical protein